MKKLLQDWLGLTTIRSEHLAALEELKVHMTAETRVVVVQMGELRSQFNLDPMTPDIVDLDQMIEDLRGAGGDPQMGGL